MPYYFLPSNAQPNNEVLSKYVNVLTDQLEHVNGKGSDFRITLSDKEEDLYLHHSIVSTELICNSRGNTSNFSSLEKTLENYKKALDFHSIVAVTDRFGVITYANDAFCL